ncbi:MFS general substrate transporter [Coniophora puteana RWD-64-598 SS2]|uniref:MFS general substrate transporter n=1 Tax=Coniophora puteana (strain RWD-64-598) TaxID=741705 RepID=A0A5M3MQ56_CONPW|nr:MFS general substrate transporter [Coniophora puteana RWD-64-598 SS2]EIW81200.1 MFS general substrate transporter [Coniophora puteana RWD-64-598 SS2]
MSSGSGWTSRLSLQRYDELSPEEQVKKAQHRAERKHGLKLVIALLLPVFLETLDYTFISTAQIHVASTFNDIPWQSWIGTSYLLTAWITVPLWTTLVVVFGRYPALMLSLIVFGVGSTISAAAFGMTQVNIGRAVAGIGGSGILMSYRIIVADQGEAMHQSAIVIMYGLAFGVGPVASGFLVDLNFRWIFGFNLPFVAVSIVLAFFFVRNVAKGSDLPRSTLERMSFPQKLMIFDWGGAILAFCAGILLLLALAWGPLDGFVTGRFFGTLAGSIVVFAAFMGWELFLTSRRGTDSPLSFVMRIFPLEVFKDITVVGMELANFVSGMSLYTLFFFIVIYGVLGQSKSLSKVNIELLFYVPGMMGGHMIERVLQIRKAQPRVAVRFGLINTVVAYIIMAIGMQSDSSGMQAASLVLFGLGGALTIGPCMAMLKAVEPDMQQRVAPLMPLFRSLGGFVGLAQSFVIMNAKANSDIKYNAYDNPSLNSTVTDELKRFAQLGGVDSLDTFFALAPEIHDIVESSYRTGIHWCFWALLPYAAIALAVSFFLGKVPPPEEASSTELLSGKTQNVNESTSTLPAQQNSPYGQQSGYAQAPIPASPQRPAGASLTPHDRDYSETQEHEWENSGSAYQGAGGIGGGAPYEDPYARNPFHDPKYHHQNQGFEEMRV